MRGDHDGLARIAHPQDRVLEAFDERLERARPAHRHAHHDLAEVGTDREVRALVADDHPAQVAVVLDVFDGLDKALHHVLPQAVGLRAELENGYAVARVEQCGLVVLPERLRLVLLQQRHAPLVGRARVALVGALPGNPDERRARRGAVVEAARGHLRHPAGRLDARLGEGVAHAVDAQGVPRLERAHLPAEAPAHRPVDVGRRVGDLGDAAGGVAEQVERRAAEEVARAARVVPEVVQAPSEPLAAQRLRVKIALGRVAVLERLRVDRADGLALLLEEARARLLARPPGLDEAGEHVGHLEGLARLVVGDVLVEVLRDVAERVQPHDVGRAERRRLRVADERARQRVDLLDREPPLRELAQRLHHAVDADAVADEVRRVLRDDDALAQVNPREG